MSELIYFGRPIDTYGNRELELQLFEAIFNYFNLQNLEILDPSAETHQLGYQKYKKEVGDGMLYFFAEVLPHATLGIFLTFADGMLGLGVWREAEYLASKGKPIFEIDRRGIIQPLILDESRKLTLEETRKRLVKKS